MTRAPRRPVTGAGAPTPAEPPALGIHDLTVRYGDRIAVDRFSTALSAGEWLCLIGPNGAGKSSLLRAVLGLLDHEGEVRLRGESLAAVGERRRAQLVAYVPQAPVLPDDMTVFEYVLLGRNPYVRAFRSESRHDRELAAAALDRLDLAGFGRRLLGTLSGGERQRLVMARALAQDTPVLVLDEPTSALDIGHQQQALDLVDSLRRERGITVLSAMHDLTLAGAYADRLALLHAGHVVVAGRPDEVLRTETLAEFYGASVRVHHEPDGTVVVVPVRTGR